MILKAFKHTRYPNDPREWNLIGNNEDYAYFNNINLLVGRNAAGKSRTLYVVREVANLLSGKEKLSQMQLRSQRFDLIFENKKDNATGDKGSLCRYILEYKDGLVTIESLTIDGVLCFERSGDKIIFGKAECLSDEMKNSLMKADRTELLITAKDADSKYHYETFTSWGKSLKNYLFSDQVKKRQMIEDLNTMKSPEKHPDVRSALLFTFYLGFEEFGEQYSNAVKDSMHQMGYTDITDIQIHETKDGYCIGVEEQGRYIVAQNDMSHGMFRALSIFIFIIYARMKEISACILIDDIGEGIDYDRSKRLIGLIIKKLHNSSIQCFMSTNDRMIMNDIPLRFWSVIDRQDVATSIVYDYGNSKEVFDDFKFTGLNNFEFLTTDFYKNGFGTENEDGEEEEDEE